jgi:hypothetical protein
MHCKILKIINYNKYLIEFYYKNNKHCWIFKLDNIIKNKNILNINISNKIKELLNKTNNMLITRVKDRIIYGNLYSHNIHINNEINKIINYENYINEPLNPLIIKKNIKIMDTIYE